ncbi:unnamed protein product [Ilex paraguariensis]|uniref:Uncharacterized protein n=1 Tax=Ilex paraguariensis TaxID=185542 RepID=A0ABC8SPT6_9AQUA
MPRSESQNFNTPLVKRRPTLTVQWRIPLEDLADQFYQSRRRCNLYSHSPGVFTFPLRWSRLRLLNRQALTVHLHPLISVSPRRSMAADQVLRKKNGQPFTNLPKNTCMCSPTTHTGSFRCSLHKNCNNTQSVSYSPNRLDALRSAMKNSLVRIGTVEGDWVKRALAALIRPSSHQQRRRASFQPRPSRLSMMSKADDL